MSEWPDEERHICDKQDYSDCEVAIRCFNGKPIWCLIVVHELSDVIQRRTETAVGISYCPFCGKRLIQ